MPVPSAQPLALSAPGWLHRVPPRLARHFWLKSLGTPAFMVVFFNAYFALLRAPSAPPCVIPSTPLDRWIGVHPLALLPYASLWLYVCLPAAVMTSLRELVGHAFGAAALAAAGLLLFLVWPTTSAPSSVDWARHPSMQFLHTVDTSGNACPSLHAAFAVFAAGWLARSLRDLGAGRIARGVNLGWAAAILFSTLATGQHGVIDAVAGALLGTLAAYVSLSLCPAAAAHSTPR